MKNIVALSLVLASAFGLSSAASAATSDCRGGYICLFGDQYYQGRFVAANNGIIDLHSADMNDLGTSVLNWTNQRWCLYSDSSYRGEHIVIEPGASIPNIGNFNDRASSMVQCNG